MSDERLGTDNAQAFPEFLLADVLDYLPLPELLLAAMPVNRYWRESVLSHPHYWSVIQLLEDAPESVSKSSCLFTLRLSRTGSKPTRVRIMHSNPGAAALVELAQHLGHITFLFLHTSPSYVAQAVEAFRAHPVPALTDFFLASWAETPGSDPIAMPPDLFSSSAPRLEHVDLSDVELSPQPRFPAFLANVTSLSYSMATREYSQVPDLFSGCPRLGVLCLQGILALDDPAFRLARNWDRLHAADLNIFGLDANLLPVGGVRRVKYHCYYHGTTTVIHAAEHLAGPLSVAFHCQHDLSAPSGVFTLLSITMRSTAGQRAHERRVETTLPTPPPGTFPLDTITAFQNAPIVDRIVRLVLSVADWDELVGRGFLTAFPALEDLVLTVADQPPETAWRSPDPSAKLSCPRLQRLILSFQRWSPRPVVEVAAVASFALAVLSDARFPLRLELNDAALDGSWKDFPDVFNRCDERELTENHNNL
ncbi:hypothetical protein AURDEDRAFT_163811 [Auricularia subglabra TFB-10046 SS5]|nr:hypothetical protein AURDEDRAFT_163811 [Auricularia subglabra TFB-10046 SS5]